VYHLARAGSTYAVLVEQDTLGAGSTGESVPSPQVTRHQRTRLTELAADRRDEHAEAFGPAHTLNLHREALPD